MNSDLIINNNEGILEITFNRPERKNAISRAMFEKILETLKLNIHNKNLRAIFISGSGECFLCRRRCKRYGNKERFRLIARKDSST